MSSRIHKNDTLSWILQKAIFTLFDHFNLFQGYRSPFSERRVALLLVDMVLLMVAAWVGFIFWGNADTGLLVAFPARLQSSWAWFPALLGGWWILAWLNDFYDIPSSYDFTQVLSRLAVIDLLYLTVYLFIYFGAPADALPRIFFLLFLLFASLLIGLWRLLYIRLSKVLPFHHRVLIVGNGRQAQTIAEALGLAPGLRYEIIGYLNDTQGSDLASTKQAKPPCQPTLGVLQDLSAFVQSHDVHEVIVALERAPDRQIVDLFIDCQASGTYVTWMPNLYEKLTRRIPTQHIDPTWALQATIGQPALNHFQLGLKRLIDLLFTLLAMPVLLLLFPIIALAIWLDSGGPIFYRQQRCGQAGKPFSIYKFRTMQTNAEANGQAQWAQVNDIRITRVGRFLRRTRLDELPQLLNILRGEMSIVGPRPERPEFVETLQVHIPYYRTRLIFKPGLTGWAQVHYPYGNTDEDAEIKLQYDFYYVRYWSIWLDLYTMFRTIGVVLRLQGI